MSTSRAYRALLRLYPSDFRALFAAEMLHAFEQAAADRRALGRSAYARFIRAELIGLATGAWAEWIAKLTTGATGRSRFARDLPLEVMDAQRRIEGLVRRTIYAIANHDFEGARTYSREEGVEREHLSRLREKYKLTA